MVDFLLSTASEKEFAGVLMAGMIVAMMTLLYLLKDKSNDRKPR